MAESAATPPAPDSAAVPTASLSATLQSLWRDLPGLLNDRVELLTLELQRAGGALARIVMLIVAAAILGVTAWLVLWAAAVMAMVAAGLQMWLALVVALLVNMGAGLWALLYARSLLPRLRLEATRRHLVISPSRALHPGPDGNPAA